MSLCTPSTCRIFFTSLAILRAKIYIISKQEKKDLRSITMTLLGCFHWAITIVPLVLVCGSTYRQLPGCNENQVFFMLALFLLTQECSTSDEPEKIQTLVNLALIFLNHKEFQICKGFWAQKHPEFIKRSLLWKKSQKAWFTRQGSLNQLAT